MRDGRPGSTPRATRSHSPTRTAGCWDRAQIARGTALLDGAVGKGRVGEYQLQAAIAAIHDHATRAAETDWPQILALYGLLERMTGNPVVTLNRAVAAGMAEGPAAGLAILDGMDGALAGNHRLEAVRAHLLEMAGDTDAADRALSDGGQADDEPPGAAIPDHQGGSTPGARRSP